MNMRITIAMFLGSVLFLSCTQRTYLTTARSYNAHDAQVTTLGQKSRPDCQHMRDTLMRVLRRRVDEFEKISDPYVIKVLTGEKPLAFYFLYCPDSSSDDPATRDFYRFSIGKTGKGHSYTVDTYRISRDLKTVSIDTVQELRYFNVELH